MSLRHIWILQQSGTCLYHNSYEDSCSDENLIGGFLSAVNSFIGSFGAEIKWIETNKLRFVFRIEKELIFVACTSIDTHAPTTYKRLERLASQFGLMFGSDLFVSDSPVSIDSFKLIAPTISRLFAIAEDKQAPVQERAQSNNLSFKFATPEARLMSFIRYKRKVSIAEVIRYLKLSPEEVEETLAKLEQKKCIQRTEALDGTHHFGLFPSFKGAF